jgi:dTMP kinase
MLITFEGIDGCGKSTQARLLAERLSDDGIETILVREPGGTELSEHVRDIVLNRQFDHPLSHTSELFLFAAARAQLVKEVILPALERNAIVICDRFTDSTIAYQGFGRGLPLAHVEHVNQLAADELTPDMTFLMDVPLETAINRRKGMGDDRMESESRTFFGHVVQGYMYLAKEHPDRIHVIDGTQSMEDIQQSIWRLVDYERGNDVRHARHLENISGLLRAEAPVAAGVPQTHEFSFATELV